MAMTIHVDIVSAEKEIYSGSVEAVFASAIMGELGIYPRHTPLLTRLKPGEVRVLVNGKEEQFYVSGGMLEVQPHLVTVLADTAMRAADVDEAAALEAKADAERALKDTDAKIDEILESNKPTTIRLKKSIPVHILYFTVYEENGLAYFKNDIYLYDKIIEESVEGNRKESFKIPEKRMISVKKQGKKPLSN